MDFPTRGLNTLDIFMTNRPSLVESCEAIEGISDHEVVLTKSLTLAHLCPPARRYIYLYGPSQPYKTIYAVTL